MNLRRKTPPDSLYLLLDTLCNAFGGIILLAVLVVLLTTKEKSKGATSGASSAGLQRHLADAEANLQASRELAASLETKASDPQWQRQMNLLSTRKELQTALQQLRDMDAVNAEELETASAADPSDRLKFLNSEFAKAQTQRQVAHNDLTAAQKDIADLQKQKKTVEKQVAVKLMELQRTLRLPVEHTPDKRAIYFIVQYGHIYPCKNIDSSQDDIDIKWTLKDGISTAEPIPERGYTAETIDTYLRQLSADEVYAVYCVFEDSFPAFIQARQTTIAAGFIYGWDPYRHQDGPVRFSVFGHTPGAQ